MFEKLRKPLREHGHLQKRAKVNHHIVQSILTDYISQSVPLNQTICSFGLLSRLKEYIRERDSFYRANELFN